ncbi:MAG: hypothetical protein GF346_03195 [Candidatus Eisenbacteria bacterium]|nr:hypothetical protein [Candidatus Latescibacterota bacterium]MBD3301427.1 hypothetical protein [Candidatus Eisenbacteria bacterium]
MSPRNGILLAAILLGFATALALTTGTGDAGLRFPHPLHMEAGLDCATCHDGIEASRSGDDFLMPADTEICLACHDQEDLEIYGWSPPKARDSRFSRFSHEAHLGLDDVDCALCHGAILDPAIAGTGRGEPGHPVCLSCHDGAGVDDACASCHDDLSVVRPLDHQADYLHTHQFEARGATEECAECHRHDDLCSDCHQGENVLFMTHDRNYLFTHPLDARKHENDCIACHDMRTFCTDCHASQGIRPANHDDNWTTGAQRHAVEARRDIGYCASCHEGDLSPCVACHTDRPGPRGADQNIHPGGFNNYGTKGPWHDDDLYYCFDCHTRDTGMNGFCGYCHAAP